MITPKNPLPLFHTYMKHPRGGQTALFRFGVFGDTPLQIPPNV